VETLCGFALLEPTIICQVRDISPITVSLSQRVMLLAACSLLSLAVLFPPWLEISRHPSMSKAGNAGYHFIFRPPMAEGAISRFISYEIDRTRLTVEIIGILLVSGLLWLVLQKLRSGN
jgi:hypothetical protein